MRRTTIVITSHQRQLVTSTVKENQTRHVIPVLGRHTRRIHDYVIVLDTQFPVLTRFVD